MKANPKEEVLIATLFSLLFSRTAPELDSLREDLSRALERSVFRAMKVFRRALNSNPRLFDLLRDCDTAGPLKLKKRCWAPNIFVFSDGRSVWVSTIANMVMGRVFVKFLMDEVDRSRQASLQQ